MTSKQVTFAKKWPNHQGKYLYQQINQQSAPNSKGAQRDTNSKGEITSPNHHQSYSQQTNPKCPNQIKNP
jgi:hypothetical protein